MGASVNIKTEVLLIGKLCFRIVSPYSKADVSNNASNIL